MKIQNNETKEKLVQRLKKIEGQVRGVQVMLNEERDCREIMQQLSAIHSSIQSTSRVFLQDYASNCLANLENGTQGGPGFDLQGKREKIVQEMITLLDKTP
ncbi:MAG: metal-sensitive transcriptional regulator [Chloroflexi bacterium]|nr:metal-sensitive transcriptional regulator [Chloroflexota bacterium]